MQDAASVGIMPTEFWELSLIEIDNAIKGAERREFRTANTHGHLTAQVLNHLRKRGASKVKAEHLFKDPDAKPKPRGGDVKQRVRENRQRVDVERFWASQPQALAELAGREE